MATGPGRIAWRTSFLGVTAAALVMECWAAWDDSPDTDPWTELIVGYVPDEVGVVALGGLMLWVPVHFVRRYRRRAKQNSP